MSAAEMAFGSGEGIGDETEAPDGVDEAGGAVGIGASEGIPPATAKSSSRS